MPYIGERLKALRMEKKLTQEELAVMLKLSKSAIVQYENNKREPNFDSLLKIENFFNVNTSYLVGKNEDKYYSSVKHEYDYHQQYVDSVVDKINKISFDESVSILVALDIALEYISRLSDEEKKITYQRLGSIISSFGQMLLNSWEMKFDTLAHPNHYLKFLQNYERSTREINEHKASLIKQALDSWMDDESKGGLEQFLKLLNQ